MDSDWPQPRGLFRKARTPDNIREVSRRVHGGRPKLSQRRECLMVSASRWLLIPALVAGWLGLAALAPAANVAPVIKDDGKFFSAEAVSKANKKIKEIAQNYNKDLLIETFSEIPADRKESYKPENKREFFEKWAREQAHENAVNGVYVLICKQPPHLQVE